MTLSKECDVAIYTEFGDYEGKNHYYDQNLRDLNGTKIILLEKKSDKIFLSVSGINLLKKDGTSYNCFFFYQSQITEFSLSDFYEKLICKCGKLGLSIKDNNFTELFILKQSINGLDVSLINNNIGINTFIPSFYLPKKYAIAVIESSINSNKLNSVCMIFDNKKLSNVKFDILYIIEDQLNEIKLTKKTIEHREKLENDKILKFKKQIDDEFYVLFKKCLRNNKALYCRGLANDIETGADDRNEINLLTKNVIEKTFKDLKTDIDDRFEAFKKDSSSKKSNRIHNIIKIDLENYLRNALFSHDPYKSIKESLLKKNCHDIKAIIDRSFEKEIVPEGNSHNVALAQTPIESKSKLFFQKKPLPRYEPSIKRFNIFTLIIIILIFILSILIVWFFIINPTQSLVVNNEHIVAQNETSTPNNTSVSATSKVVEQSTSLISYSYDLPIIFIMIL